MSASASRITARRAACIVRPIGHLNVISPPLVMTTAQIDELVAILRESIIQTADELTREGHRLT